MRQQAGRLHASPVGWALALLLGLAPSASAETRLEGSAADTSEAAVAGALVVLRHTETGFERLVRTDGSGRFAFPGLEPGRYRLIGQARGFAPSRLDLEVPAASPARLVLRPAAVVEQITVVSGSREQELRSSLNARVDVVTRERMRDSGDQTVGEVLREMPGVLSRRGSATSAVAGQQVQGIDSRQVLVLIDGQPVVGARGIKRGVLNLDRQSVERLERIEVVKGASSALYGSDAIGGVINLVTREADRPFDASLTASGGSLGTFDGRGAASFARGRWSGLLSLERHQHDGFDLFPSTPDTTGAPFRRHDAFGKARYVPSQTLSLSAFGNAYWHQSDARALGEVGLQASHIEERAQNLGLTADWRISSRATVKARGYTGRFDEEGRHTLLAPDPVPIEPDELHERLFKLDATLSHVWGGRQYLQFGGEWWSDEYSGVNRLRDADGERATTRVLWGQDRIALPGGVTLTLGARYDDHSVFGSAFSPKAAVNVRAGDRARLRASYGRGFRAPDLGQLFYRFLNPSNLYQVLGNPRLRPEYASSYQAGAEIGSPGGRALLGVNLFRNEVRDLIDSVSLGFVASPGQLAGLFAREGIDPTFQPVLNRLLLTYRNVAGARTQGLEADGEAVLGRGFSLQAAYTYLEAEDRTTGLALTNRNKHQGVARVAWENVRMGTRANVRGSAYSSWIAARSTTGGAIRDTVAPAFLLWDLYAAQRIRNGVEAFLAVDNVMDSQDPNTGLLDVAGRPLAVYRPDAGRAFRVGVRLTASRP